MKHFAALSLRPTVAAMAVAGLLSTASFAAVAQEDAEHVILALTGDTLIGSLPQLVDDKLVVKADGTETGSIVGIQAAGSVSLLNEGQALDLEIGLSRFQNTVGVRFAPDEWGFKTLDLQGNALIEASVALQGDGELNLRNAEDKSIVIRGGIEMAGGSIVNGFQVDGMFVGNTITYTGNAVLGSYESAGDWAVLHLGDGVPGSERAFMKLETANLQRGTIAVHGAAPREGFADSGSVLMVGSIVNKPEEDVEGADIGTMPGGTITVDGNGVLVLGTYLDRANENVDSQIRGFADLSDELKVQARLAHILADADSQTDNPNRTTLLLAADAKASDYASDVGIHVGTAAGGAAAADGIYVHDDGRLVIYFDDETGRADEFAAADGGAGLTVNVDDEAQLVLHGWDGVTDIAVNVEGNLKAENFYSLGGVRAQIVDGVVQRQYCWQFAGLRASEMVRGVETEYRMGEAELRAGYRFIVDSLTEDRVGRNAYANVIDAAVFLPVTSGVAAAFERAERAAFDAVLARDLSLFEGKGHWWASGSADTRKAPEIFSGGSGSWGFEADTVTGAVGYDFALGKNWIGGVAVTAGGIDTESVGQVAKTTGDTSFGGVVLTAARNFDSYGEVRLALSYMRAEGDAEQIVNGHRLETEPEIEIMSAAARWQRSFALGGGAFTIAPVVQLGVHTADMRNAEIIDRTEAVTGVGFKTEAERRIWATAFVGMDAAAETTVYGYRVVPKLSAAFAGGFGDRQWDIASSLFDGTGRVTTSYDSAQKRSVRLSGSLKIAHSGFDPEMQGGIFGFGAKTTGKTLPFSWSLELTAGGEFAADGEDDVRMGLEFRQLF